MAGLLDLLSQTWPVRMAKGAWDAAQLPGDVYAGRVAQNDPQYYNRALDLASLMVGMPGGGGGLGSSMRLPLRTPESLYHVAGPSYQEGQPLKSLFRQYGNDAYDMFAKKWPEAGDLNQYHAHLNFFYDGLPEAISHAENFGGKVLKVDPKMVDQLHRDTLERPGFWVSPADVPADALSSIKIK